MKPVRYLLSAVAAAAVFYGSTVTVFAAGNQPAAVSLANTAVSDDTAAAADSLIEAQKKLISDSVAAGIITKEEADAMLKVIEDNQNQKAQPAAAPAPSVPAVQPAAAAVPAVTPANVACIYGGYCYGNGAGICDGTCNGSGACYNNYNNYRSSGSGYYYSGHHSSRRGHGCH